MRNARQMQLELDLAIALSANKYAEAERIQNQLLALQNEEVPAVQIDIKDDAEAASLRLIEQMRRDEEIAERKRREEKDAADALSLAAIEDLKKEEERKRKAAEAEKLTRRMLAAEKALEDEIKQAQEAASLAVIEEIMAQEHALLVAANNMFRVANGQRLLNDLRPVSKDIDACIGFLADKPFQELMQTPAVQGERDARGNIIMTDAHKFTRTLIRNGIPILVKIDDALKLSNPNMLVADVLKEVLEFVATMPEKDRPNIANIQKSLGLIPGNNYIEGGETGAHVPQLLSRVWSLAKRYGRSEMGLIAQILHLNIADAGSCMPGLVARLYSPFALILNDILNRSVNAAPALPADIGPGAAVRRDHEWEAYDPAAFGVAAAGGAAAGEWQEYDPAQFDAAVAGPAAQPKPKSGFRF